MARPWSDSRLERALGNVLRDGVILAGAVVAAGAAVFLVRHGGEAPQYGMFRGEPSDLRHVGGIVGDALAGRGRGLIQLGLLLLIATPVARVVFAAVGFALERDRTYVAVALVVLAVLAFSLAGGHL